MHLCKIIQKNWLKLRNFRLLQPTFPKPKQPVENYTGYQFPEQISKREIQDVNTRNNKNLPPDRRMGNIHRLQGCLLPHTNPGSTYIITSRVNPTNSKHYLMACPQLPLSSLLFTEGGQTSHKDIRIYLDDWLVRARSHQACLQNTQKLVALSGAALDGEQRKTKTGPQTSLQLCRLPVRSTGRSDQPQSIGRP